MNQRRLTISNQLLRHILEHCLEEKPLEACGILTGKEDVVLHAYATENARQSPVFYEVEPVHQATVLQEMEERGEKLLAIYHSHPTTAAEPSGNDIRLAVHWPEALRVIVSLAGAAVVRAFLIQSGKVQEVPIRTVPDGGGVWEDLRARPRA